MKARMLDGMWAGLITVGCTIGITVLISMYTDYEPSTISAVVIGGLVGAGYGYLNKE